MDVYQQIGINVKSLREKKGLSIEQVAKKAGLTETFVKFLERGKRKRITLKTMEGLCYELNATSEEIFPFE